MAAYLAAGRHLMTRMDHTSNLLVRNAERLAQTVNASDLLLTSILLHITDTELHTMIPGNCTVGI